MCWPPPGRRRRWPSGLFAEMAPCESAIAALALYADGVTGEVVHPAGVPAGGTVAWRKTLTAPSYGEVAGADIGTERLRSVPPFGMVRHMPLAVWSVTESGPIRLAQSHDFLEKQLEDWIRSDATLVSEGLSWVARQPHLPDLSIPDLIGLTREGGLVVAELKRGPVTVATLSQALHYVLVLGSMEAEAVLGRLTLTEEARSTLTESYQADSTPDFSIMLVGTGRLPELDRAAAFLAARGLNVPVRIVTFTPFIGANGDILLTRYEEDHELEAADLPRNQQPKSAARIEWVQDAARELGVGGAVEAFMQTATDLELGIKPWPKSLTMVAPFTHGRTLLYIKPSHQGAAHFGYSAENLTQLYGADSGSLVSRLGSNWVDLSTEDVKHRLADFALLMRDLQHPEEAAPVPSI